MSSEEKLTIELEIATKKCPECGANMIGVRTAIRWTFPKVEWYCACGHEEEASEGGTKPLGVAEVWERANDGCKVLFDDNGILSGYKSKNGTFIVNKFGELIRNA